MLKKILTVAIPVLLIVACKKSCPECEACKAPDCIPNLDSALLAYFPFNGNMNDESGHNLQGIAHNGAHLSTNMLGTPNSALELDGIDDYVSVDLNGKLISDEISVSFYVMVKNTNRRQSLVGISNFQDNTGQTWGFGQSFDQQTNWEFIIDDPNAHGCSDPYYFSEQNIVRTPESTIAEKWYHVIGTFNKQGEQKLYINGVLKASTKRNFQALKKCNLAQLLIGAWWKNDVISLDGKIDEIRIYGRVISDCEIKELGKVSVATGSSSAVK